MGGEKVTLVELLTEHEYHTDEGSWWALCQCGAKAERPADKWQWWIGHVQQAIGTKMIELNVTLLPYGEWDVKSFGIKSCADTTGGTG